MAFIEHRRTRGNLIQKEIKASFIKRGKDNLLTLTFHKEMLRSLDMDSGDRVRIFYEEDNPRLMLLVKSTDNVGYKLVQPPQKNIMKIQFTWKAKGFVYKDSDYGSHSIEHEIKPEGLIIKL